MSQVTGAMPVQRGLPADRPGLLPAGLVGGVGGLVFVATVVAQNVVRAKDLPANDAGAASVAAYYAAHHGTTVLLAALYPVGALGLACFLGAMLSRLSAAGVRAPALAGAFGATGIIAMFTMTVATDVALAEYVHRGSASAAVVSALWVLHNAVFGVLLVSIGVALIGFSAAAAADGLVPDAWKGIGLVGGIALAVAGACTPAIVDGSKVIGVGLVGFVAWGVFVVTCAVALIRRRVSPGL
jgi:hypothetical protein